MDTNEWMVMGKYEVMVRPDKFRIFPKNSEGESRPIWIKRVYLELRRVLDNGASTGVTFKYYLHQRNLYWSDSRDEKGSRPRHYIRKELARLLFEKDQKQAEQFMFVVESYL